MDLNLIFERVVVDDPEERLVLLSLGRHADDKGHNAYPSITTIMNDTLLSRRTVIRRLGALEARGVIVRGDQEYPELLRIPAPRRPVNYNIEVPARHLVRRRAVSAGHLTGVSGGHPTTNYKPLASGYGLAKSHSETSSLSAQSAPRPRAGIRRKGSEMGWEIFNEEPTPAAKPRPVAARKTKPVAAWNASDFAKDFHARAKDQFPMVPNTGRFKMTVGIFNHLLTKDGLAPATVAQIVDAFFEDEALVTEKNARDRGLAKVLASRAAELYSRAQRGAAAASSGAPTPEQIAESQAVGEKALARLQSMRAKREE